MNDYSDFQRPQDGFTEVNDQKGADRSDGAEDGASESSSNGEGDNAGPIVVDMTKVNVIVVPSDAKTDSDAGFQVVVCANLADLGHAIKTIDMPFFCKFDDLRHMREAIKRSAMFGVKMGVLFNIPDTRDDVTFNSIVWGMPRFDYSLFIAKVREAATIEQAARRRDTVAKRIERQRTIDANSGYESSRPKVGAGSQEDGVLPPEDTDDLAFEG